MYLNAQTLVKKASDEAFEISIQTKELIKQQDEQCQLQIAANIKKLQENAAEIIYYQQQKIQKQISQKIVDFAIKKVNQKIKIGLNQKIQKLINDFSIRLLITKKF